MTTCWNASSPACGGSWPPARPERTWTRFLAAAAELGFTERVRTATASQVPARLLIQTGRRLDQLTIADLEEFAAACQDRQERTGKGWWHYQWPRLSNTQRVLFHLRILGRAPQLGRAGRASLTGWPGSHRRSATR